MRERMEEHRANPACSSCHRVIDPLGLALENFDVTGKWRIKDNGVPVDAAGELYDGTQIDGAGRAARRAAEALRTCSSASFTENLMTYALGRRVEDYDMPAVRAHRARRGAEQTTGCRRSSWASSTARRSDDAGAGRTTTSRASRRQDVGVETLKAGRRTTRST